MEYLFLLAVLLVGCSSEEAVVPAPQQPDSTAVSYFCAMTVNEHNGPGGQVFRRGYDKPIWLASVRDTFTYLEFEGVSPAEVRAIYVTDMSTSTPGRWIEAKTAYYIIDSGFNTAMGGVEALPFPTRAVAEAFQADNGGQVVDFVGAHAAFSLKE